jgi:NAD+ synthase (glutamine-hydrolysing)
MLVALAQINPLIGDFKGNTDKILECIEQARQKNAKLVLFSELVLTGYPPEDLLFQEAFLKEASLSLEKIVKHAKDIALILGVPRQDEKGRLFNSAVVIENQQIIGFQDKTLLPSYDVFNETRYFHAAEKREIFTVYGKKIAVTICEDIWHNFPHPHFPEYAIDPLKDYEGKKIDYCVNLSASPYHLEKFDVRRKIAEDVVDRLKCPFYLCNQVGANDSLIFEGLSFAMNPNKQLFALAKNCQEDLVVADPLQENTCHPVSLLADALILGLRDYFKKQGFKQACIGISGGIDSAVVACLAKEALGKENVLGVMMPSRYTSEESVVDAEQLIANLGIESLTLPIEEPFKSFLSVLEATFKDLQEDVTEENIQARIRGTLLMALSNKLNRIVLSTGNKSEMALGYATLYGDLAGGLAILSDVTKGLVYELGHHFKVIPENIFKKAPTAELKANQKDADTLPDYAIVDKVVTLCVEEGLSAQEIVKKTGFDQEIVKSLIKRIYKNEYKRRQSPPGLKISQKAFTVGRRFPIVQKFH